MPRQARISIAGLPLHVVHRGANRAQVFFSPDDYACYLAELGEFAELFGCELHAYVLMTNHVHVFLTPRETASATLLMKNVAQRHAQRINKMHRRTGPLWEGRFRSCIVDDDQYTLACHRYIEMNPVRAGLVVQPDAYRWSSYMSNAEGVPSPLLTPHDSYLGLGPNLGAQADAYKLLFAEIPEPGIVSKIREATLGNHAIGGAEFIAQLSQALGRRVGRGRPGRPPKQKTGTVLD